MAIRPPILDDHSFDSLVEEMLARIPAHTPERRNPRQGDPGRTLIELFAWLADTILYRANLIPERQRLVFLRLLGIQMRPAIPARGIVTLSIDEEQPTKAITIRPLARVKGPVNFETLSELTVLPVTAESYYKRKLSTDEVSELGVNLVAELQSVYQVDKAEPYITTPIFGDGLPDVTGFDLGERTVDRSLWVALLAADAAVKEQISSTIGESENGGQHVITIGIEPTVTVPELFEEIGPRATVPFVWEVTGVRTKNGKQETEYHRLDLIEDTTNGLTRRGIQRLVLPASEYIDAPTNDVRDDHRAGVGDMPPRLDDVELANRLVAWLRLRPAVGGDNDASLPGNISLSWVGINAVEIDARQTMTGRIVGQSDGSANQEIQLPGQSVDPATLVLQVESKGQGFQTWQPIDDLVFARRDELAYSLESDSGIVRIGNGLRGHLPFRGARVRVEQMRFGGGQSGNLPSGSLADITAKALDGSAVTNLK